MKIKRLKGRFVDSGEVVELIEFKDEIDTRLGRTIEGLGRLTCNGNTLTQDKMGPKFFRDLATNRLVEIISEEE